MGPTSLVGVQNRMALDMLLAEKGGVCSMFGDQCCTYIPNNTAPGGSVTVLLYITLMFNAVVRKCMAQHLANLVEKVGAARLLSWAKDLTDRILPAVVKLAQDSSQEVSRDNFGRRMLLSLSSHPEFEKILEKYIPTKDLQTVRDTVFTLKTKGLGKMPQDTQADIPFRASGTVRASSLNREPLNQTNRWVWISTNSFADKTEYIKQISDLLASKDFRERIKGIDQLVADCQNNPNMVFDAFRARLQESNSKVNLYALESLQKIIHLLKDKLGKAKVNLIEKVADLVTELYPRKPQMVKQKVLPLLWHLLGTSTHSGTIHGRGGSVRGATANLCQALYAQMGPSLSKCAASQPANVHKSLNDILRTLS
uniref:TOG domain-containing protein n=1 Tax=Maylandia zebra TaxID=106582 RepID=A0A3P9C3H2_9CICH